MPLNLDAVGTVTDPTEMSWDSKDAILYALGVGAGTDELPFVTENSIDVDQKVFPTMAVVLGVIGGGMASLGDFNWAMLVHGEQGVRLHQPIPVVGTLSCTTEITGIFDKGKGAVVVMESKAKDAATGEPLFNTTMSAFIRGEGGFGGDRGPSGPRNVPPERAPDHSVTYATRPDQALIYRLSGDRNPLHSDPQFAALAGFDRPILHGLCTFGFTGRALLHTLCDGEPSRFTSMDGRFSSPVFPGEPLTVNMWVDGGEAVFQTTGDDGRVVLDAGKCEFTD
ncbi:MAG: MaoC/PaaZ C-terminal domain-containing protein [Acidimicrobiales bacterium]